MAISSLPVDFAFALRRAGIELSTAQVIDLGRAMSLVGLEDETSVLETARAVCLTRRDQEDRFVEAFRKFFHARRKEASLLEELRMLGLSDEEVEAVRAAIRATSKETDLAYGALVFRGADYDHLLAIVGDASKEMRRLGQLGQIQERTSEALGLLRLVSGLSEVERRISAILGPRAQDVMKLLRDRLKDARRDVRSQMRERFEERTVPSPKEQLVDRAFASLEEREIEEVKRVVRLFGERLRGGELVRRKRERKGRFDAKATVRASMRTGGVPMRLMRRRPHRKKPRLVLLCDVSDSVRAAATFMLEFVAVAHDLFENVRSFVFVSDVKETTNLFAREPLASALSRISSGEVISTSDNSNYGNVFRAFMDRYGKSIDRRSTVVILGDARTNYSSPLSEVLGELRARAHELVWLNPEKKSQWGAGDSAILQYQAHCSRVLEVSNVEELEDALRRIGHLRARR